MQTIWNRIEKLTRRGTWVVLLSLVAGGLLTPRTWAQTSANSTVVNQVVPLAPLTADGTSTGSKGGWNNQTSPAGGTFAVDSHGNVIVGTEWAKSVLQVNTATGAVTQIATPAGAINWGATAVDSAGNLYVSNAWGASIYKIPYVAGTGYAAFSSSSLPTSVCQGAANTTTDTAACQFAVNFQNTNGWYGIAAMAIDSAGNFWIATNQYPGSATNGSNVNNNIMMCDPTCQTAAAYTSGYPVVAYNDSTNPTDEIGGLAVDPWGNVFFALSQINESGVYSGSASSGTYGATTSGLYELSPVVGGYTYDGPVVTYTNSQSYNNGVFGVAIDPVSGTVYFTTPQDGIFAVPNTQSGGPDTTAMYTVSLVGGNGIALDSSGNLYQIAYSSAFVSGGIDTVEQIRVNNVTTPITGQQQTMDVPVTVIDNGAAVCTGGTPSTLGFTFSGTNASQFKAAVNAATPPATTSCASQGISGTSPATVLGVSFPVTVAYTPTGVGTSTATMTTTDAVTDATGSAALTGLSEKQQSISFTTSLSWTYSSGLTITLAATGGKSGNPVVFTVVSGPGTLESDGVTLDVSAPGNIVVEVNQAGNATYAPAPTVTKTIAVAQIAQAITLTAPPRNVTTTASPITLTATGGASGNPVVFTLDPSSTGYVSGTSAAAGTLSGTNNDTVTFSGTAGNLVIDVNQAGNTDYAAAPQVQATIVVSAALLPTGPPVILSQTTFLGILTGGGATSNGNPNGGTMAIDKNGDAVIGTTYGSSVLSFNISNPNAGHQSVLDADPGNPGAIAIDSNGNLFVGETYNANGGSTNPTCMGPCLLKIPYANGTYAPLTAPPANTVTCTGPTTDATACWLPSVSVPSGNYPIVSLAFDSHGNLFYGIENNSAGDSTSGITYPDTIWECDANCLYGGGDTPQQIFAEPASSTTSLSPSVAVQLTLGSLAVDAAGNIFFTDAAIDASSLVHYSNLNELVNNSGTYPTSATVLAVNIPSAPGQYVGTIDALAIDSQSGNVYFSDQGATYAFADNGSALSPQDVDATMWTVSPQGAKFLAVAPGGGTIYQANYEGAESKDSMFYTTVGSVTVPGTVIDGQTGAVPGTGVIGTSTTPLTQMYTVLNDGNCTNPETATFSSTAAEFTAAFTQTGTPPAAVCSGTFTQASWFATTLTFAPVSPDNNAVTGTLTATDSDNNSGTAAVAGTAQNLIPQTISGFAGITSPVIYGGGPYTLSATGGASGNPVVFSIGAGTTQVSGAPIAAVSGTNGTTLTITGVGTVVIDIDQAGNSTYQAGSLQETITVNQAPQTIQFGTLPTSVAYGVAPITLSATDTNVSGSGSGNSITFSLDSGTTGGAATLTGNTLTITGLGTVIVDAAQAGNADYQAGSATATIMVTQGTQTITFAPPASVPYGSSPVTLTATASSGLTVALSLNAGKTTSAGSSLTGNVLTIGGLGNIVIDANQAGNSDYAAAAQVEVTIQVTSLGTVATPSISPASGTLYTNGTPADSITITDTTANATIYYTTDGTDPLNSGTAVMYTGAITLPQSTTAVTVTARAEELGYMPSSSATATYTISNLPPNFTVSVNPPAVDLSPGGSATIDITITPNASFANIPITFACSGAPAGVTCAFAPPTVTPNGVNAVSTVLTIMDAATTSAVRHGPNPFIPGGATFALALCFFGWKRRRGLVLTLVLMAGIFGLTQLTGCGSSSGNSLTGTTTSTMTVTATGGGVTQTLPVTITIRK